MGIQNVDTRALTRGPLEAKILRIESPSRMWIHLKNSEGGFKDLLEELSWWMEHRRRRLIMWPSCVYEGALVALKVNGKWQRGELTRVINDDLVKIALRDWGTQVTRDLRTVFQLPDQFATTNRTWEAIPCSLANLLPFGGGQKWRDDDLRLAKFLGEGQRAYIKIRGSTEDGAGAYVDLTVIRSNGHSVNLRELLQILGCGYHWSATTTEAQPGLRDIKY